MDCASSGDTRVNQPEYRNKRAESLFHRSEKELKKNEFTPAVTDLLHAELLVVDEELRLAIINLKEDIYNHILVQTDIEDGASLKYTGLDQDMVENILKLVIESVPMVTVENEKIRIEELRHEFIVANIGEGDEIILESVENTVDSIVEFFETFFDDIFHGGRHHHMR